MNDPKRTRIAFHHVGRSRWARAPFENIREIASEIRFFWQRGMYGYADCDVWSLRWYLSHVLPGAIRQLRATGHSHPMINRLDLGIEGSEKLPWELSDAEGAVIATQAMAYWHAILDRMAQGFEIVRDLDEHPDQRREFYNRSPEFIDELEDRAFSMERALDDDVYEIPTLEELDPDLVFDRAGYDAHEAELERLRCEGFDLFRDWFWDLWD